MLTISWDTLAWISSAIQDAESLTSIQYGPCCTASIGTMTPCIDTSSLSLHRDNHQTEEKDKGGGNWKEVEALRWLLPSITKEPFTTAAVDEVFLHGSKVNIKD